MSFAGGAGYSVAGNRYGELNQDASFAVNSLDEVGELSCYGVFDGHGLLGEYASRIASSSFEMMLGGWKPNEK